MVSKNGVFCIQVPEYITKNKCNLKKGERGPLRLDMLFQTKKKLNV